MTAPERIWAIPLDEGRDHDFRNAWIVMQPEDGAVEYVRAEVSEARLAKAVEAMRVLLATAYADDHAGWQDALKEARAVLAEIEGGKKDE